MKKISGEKMKNKIARGKYNIGRKGMKTDEENIEERGGKRV